MEERKPPLFSAAQACWNQRNVLAGGIGRLKALADAVDSPVSFARFQWAQMTAAVLEFRPDVILELGRAMGNSTAAFTNSANLLGPSACRVLSLCLSYEWHDRTVPRLRRAVPAEWFAPLDARVCDISTFDFRRALAGAQRVMVFWDAHGFAIAECVLGGILPAVADRPHMAVMHDISDNRYAADDQRRYGDRGLWKGGNDGSARIWLDWVDSGVEQAVSAMDFAARNRLALHSAEHELRTEIGSDAQRLAEMQRLLGEFFSLQAHWAWFSLNETPGPWTFPPFDPCRCRVPLKARCRRAWHAVRRLLR